MGVTGARDQVGTHAADLVERTRVHTSLPIGVGLGVRSGDQAAEVASFADAVIDTLQHDQGERIARGRVIADAFDWEKVGGRILDVFERVAGTPSDRAGLRPKAAA